MSEAATTDLTVEEFLKERVDKQQQYFSKKSSEYQKKYFRLKTITIVLAVTIPFLASQEFFFKDWLVGLSGVLIAISEGILGLYKYQDNWLEFRGTSEALKHEKILFRTRTNQYHVKGEEDVFRLFVDRVEGILNNERENWKSNMSEDD